MQGTGGEVVGACAMVNKNKDLDKNMFSVPFSTLVDMFVDTYKASDCPLCKTGVPINMTIGHGKKFLEGKK